MIEITKGFTKLSKELGVKHVLNEDIDSLNVIHSQLIMLVHHLQNINLISIFLVLNIHVQTRLLSEKHRSYLQNIGIKKCSPVIINFLSWVI